MSNETKLITQVIEFLQNVEAAGGDIISISHTAGIRVMDRSDPEFSERDHRIGIIQRKPDGTFTLLIKGMSESI